MYFGMQLFGWVFILVRCHVLTLNVFYMTFTAVSLLVSTIVHYIINGFLIIMHVKQ